MTDVHEIIPITHGVQGTIRPPGSKSITNRALIIAALADGPSQLTGVLHSRDTEVMLDSLERLGIAVQHHRAERKCVVIGQGGSVPAPDASLWLENSGTSIRFLTSLCCLGRGEYRLDGIERMRERPIRDLTQSLTSLGAHIHCDDTGCPPVVIRGSEGRLAGGTATIAGNISSQYLSSLLMAAPYADAPVTLSVDGELVSQPYVTMTIEIMRAFGVNVDCPTDLSSFHVEPAQYQACPYDIEPDASAASYFFGAAAVTGGSVKVSGLSQNALQGDIQFVSALERMGCDVTWSDDDVTVSGGTLHGIDIDMGAISDTAQTLATVAVFADSPTHIRGVEHMRHKETDRVAAVVTELQRAGIRAEEFTDGLKIYPGTPRPARIETYDDHRMAMSFALLGLRNSGICILDPECTSKTYPDFFADLNALCSGNLV